VSYRGELWALLPQVFGRVGDRPQRSHGVGAFSYKGRQPSGWALVICLVEMGFEPWTFNDIVSHVDLSVVAVAIDWTPPGPQWVPL